VNENEALKYPLHAVWIGQPISTFERTERCSSPFLSFQFTDGTSGPDVEEIAEWEPGRPVVIEFASRENPYHSVQACERLIHKIIVNARLPVILSVGHKIPAETVVEWIQMGLYSYVEQTADDARFQTAFSRLASESLRIQRQNQRYENLYRLWSQVTEREAAVLHMLMEGLPNKTIANRLGVSQRTIEARRQKLYEKLESRSIAAVVKTIYELNDLEQVFQRRDPGHDLLADNSNEQINRRTRTTRPILPAKKQENSDEY